MGIIKRQSLKSSIVNYVGVLIGVIFFNFIFPHLISEQHLGMIRLLQSLMFILVALPTLGLGHVLLRFYSNWKEDKMLNSFNGFALIATGLASVVFILLYIVFKDYILGFYKVKSALFVPYYYLVIPLVVTQAYIQYFELYSMVKLRVAFPAFIREILVRVMLVVLVYLFSYHVLNEQQFFYGVPIVYAISALLIIVYAFRFQDFGFQSPSLFLKNSDLKHQLLYGGGMFIVLVFTNIHNFVDGIILSSFLGVGAFGIYGIPLVLGQMIQVPYRAISQISLPIIRDAWVDHDMEKIQRLNKSLGLNLFLIGCFLYTLLIINATAIFELLPPQYKVAESVLYIIGAGRLLDMAFGLNSEILNTSGQYKYFVALTIVLVILTITLNIWLIPIYGMNGAALAVSISLTIFNLMKTLILYMKYHFHCFSKHYLTLIMLMLFVIGVCYLIPMIEFIPHHMFMNALANVAFKSFIGATLFLVPMFFLKISHDFNDFILLILSGKIFKGGHRMEEL